MPLSTLVIVPAKTGKRPVPHSIKYKCAGNTLNTMDGSSLESTPMTMNISDDADLHITIYDIGGKVVRRLNLGHQMAGYYMNREKAAHWDGKSEIGELASSGP